MASPALLRRVFATPTAESDADLLARFTARRDSDAFAELVRRHGPVVYRICRRLLGDATADDAFQATFLILVTRPTAVRKASSVGSWLVGVAGRVARQTRKAHYRRVHHEQASGRREPAGATPPDLSEQIRILDEELTRLPDRLRSPVVLCLLQGRTQEQAAADLGGSVRTVRRRLDEAKTLLRLRLERRGVVPAVAAGLVSGIGSVTASVPVDLTDRATALVFDFLAGGPAISAPAALLAQGVATTMLARKVKLLMVAAALGLTALGVGMADDAKPAPKPEAPATLPPANLPVPGLVIPGVEAPPLAEADPTRYTSPNFVVSGPSHEVAKQVATAAETARQDLALAWLGRELPNWEKPCPIQVEIRMNGSGGATTFTYSDDPRKPAVRTMEMKLFGDLPGILRDTVRHEVMHCVLATAFGKPLPRWADEGIAIQAESGTAKHEHSVRCRELLNQGRGIPLKVLFELKEYPKDVMVLFAQGYSVCEYLLSRSSGLKRDVPGLTDQPLIGVLFQTRPELVARTQLLQFVELGTSDGWEKAAKDVYGFASLDAMQEAWFAWLRQPPKAASAIPPPAAGPTALAAAPSEYPTVGGLASSKSFDVVGELPAVARALASELAVQRREQSGKWVGWRVPSASKQPIRVEYISSGNNSYLNVFSAGDKLHPDSIHLFGTLALVLESDIPQIMARAVFIEHFGQDLPYWALNGLPAVEAAPEVQRMLDSQGASLSPRGKL